MGARLALVHTAKKLSHAYLVTDYTKETKTNIEVLRRTLDAQEALPPTLVLQQENKNSRFFAFVGELVESGARVVINFLPVGHTHVRSFPAYNQHAYASCLLA